MESFLNNVWCRFFAVFAFIDVLSNVILFPKYADNPGPIRFTDLIDAKESYPLIVDLLVSFRTDIAWVDFFILGSLIFGYFGVAFIGMGFLVLVIRDPLEFGLNLKKWNNEID